MIFRLFTRSAIRPPTGDITARGRKAKPDTIPSREGEWVTDREMKGECKADYRISKQGDDLSYQYKVKVFRKSFFHNASIDTIFFDKFP